MKIKNGLKRVLGVSVFKKQIDYTFSDVKRICSLGPERKKTVITRTITIADVSTFQLRKQYHFRYIAAWCFLLLGVVSLSALFLTNFDKVAFVVGVVSFVTYLKYRYFMYLIYHKKTYIPFLTFAVSLIKEKAILPSRLPHDWALETK